MQFFQEITASVEKGFFRCCKNAEKTCHFAKTTAFFFFFQAKPRQTMQISGRIQSTFFSS
jgi:hypothetical protein